MLVRQGRRTENHADGLVQRASLKHKIISNSIKVFASLSRFRLYRQIERRPIPLSLKQSMLVER
jgi:hypothetical protein